MKLIKFLLAIYLGFILVSCNSDIEPNGSNFIVIASSPGLWTISNYNSLTDEYVQIAQSADVKDAALINDNLFTINYRADSISKIQLSGSSQQEIATKVFVGPNEGYNDYGSGKIEEFGDMIIMTAQKYLDGKRLFYLNYYDIDLNLIDSLIIAEVPSDNPVLVFDILAAGENIFLSLENGGVGQFIIIIDGLTNKIIQEFEVDVAPRELAFHNNVLYGFSLWLLYQVDITSMSLSSTELNTTVSQDRSSSIVFTSNDIFYFLPSAPQPSSTPHLLASYNLSNNSTQIHSPGRFEYMAPPMSYESNNKHFITSGGRNTISLFRLDGSLVRDVTIPEDDINFILQR